MTIAPDSLETAWMHPVQVRHPMPTTYCRVASYDEAADILAASGSSARVVAGGTDVLIEMARGGRTGIDVLVDLGAVADASELVVDHVEGVVRIGPGVTHAQIISRQDVVDVVGPLAQACREIGSPQLRNRATVVGNVVTASPANDTISALLALDAAVVVRSTTGERTEPLAAFITSFRTTSLASTEFVIGLRVPMLRANQRGVFAKLGNRAAQAISVVHAAAVVSLASDQRTVVDVRLAVGSVAPTVVLLAAAAEHLVGTTLDTASIAAASAEVSAAVEPIDDVRATADYRRHVVGVLVSRMLTTIANAQQLQQWEPHPITLGGTTQGAGAAVRVDNGQLIAAAVNGVAVHEPWINGASLLDWLRDGCGLTGVKEGCAEGECGACTVLLDGRAVMSCVVVAAQAHGAHVTTVEGLSSGADLHPVQQAFVDRGAVQCGYCTPGFLVASSALIDEVGEPTVDQICSGLNGNLCRCTGYAAIVNAVRGAGHS